MSDLRYSDIDDQGPLHRLTGSSQASAATKLACESECCIFALNNRDAVTLYRDKLGFIVIDQ